MPTRASTSMSGEAAEAERRGGDRGVSRRVPFERTSLDQYRVTSPPSLSDELRAVIQQYSTRNTLRLCRRGKQILRPDGSIYRPPCGNKWSCPLCSPARLGQDQANIEHALQSATYVVFVTLTVAREERLPASRWLTPILETWSAAFSTGSWMRDFRGRTNMVGWVRSIELTMEHSGAHAHIHAALLFGTRPLDRDLEKFISQWITAAARRGHRASRGAQVWERVSAGPDRSRVAFYLCEQNAIRQSRHGKGRTPGDALHAVAATGDADDLELLLRFHEAVAGKRKISTSRGFWEIGEAQPFRRRR